MSVLSISILSWYVIAFELRVNTSVLLCMDTELIYGVEYVCDNCKFVCYIL